MSCLNVFVEPDRARVGVDTMIQAVDGRAGHCGKFHYLPAVHGILAGRGLAETIVSVLVAAQMIDAGEGNFIDGVAAHLAKTLPKVRRRELWANRRAPNLEFVLAGWSAPQGCMTAWAFRSEAGFTPEPIEGTYIAPGHPELAEAWVSTPAQMLDLLARQVALTEERHGTGHNVGGNGVMMALGRTGAQIVQLGPIGPTRADAA